MANKSEKMQVTQVVELLRQGNIEALVHVPQSLVIQATAELGKANRQRGLGATVYEASGSIGITGIRTRPIVAYGAEWDAIEAFMSTDAFKEARANPLCSTGTDDPRYAGYREQAKAKAKAEREARK